MTIKNKNLSQAIIVIIVCVTSHLFSFSYSMAKDEKTNKGVNEHIVTEVRLPNDEIIELNIPRSSPEELQKLSPSTILSANANQPIGGVKNWVPHLGNSVLGGFGHTLRHIPTEAWTFYTAVGAMAVLECSFLITSSNPTACSNFYNELSDPLSYISFFLFMGANHSTSTFLNPRIRMQANVKPTILPIPNAAIHYAGMSAGALLSHFASDVYLDSNLTYIRKHFFDDKKNWTPVDQANWEKAWSGAYEQWISTEKVFSYVPTVLSITLSMYAASLTSASLSALTNKLVSRLNKQPAFKTLTTLRKNVVTRALTTLDKKAVTGALTTLGRKTVTRTNLWLTTVISIMHFLSWDKYFFTPIITKSWSLATSIRSMRHHENAILYQLASAYQSQDIQGNGYYSYKHLLDFLNDDIHRDDSHQQYQREYLRQHCPHPQCHNEWDYLSENKNKNFFNRSQGAFTHLRPSVFHLPILFHESYSDISGVPNLTDVIEQQDDKDITRGERLLEEIIDLDKDVKNYRYALNQEFQTTISNWHAFFKPLNEWRSSMYLFYAHLIQIKDQLSFTEEEPSMWSWQSKGMLDAWYFDSRTLDQSIHINSLRLYLESQLLQLGLKHEVIVVGLSEVSDSNLWDITRLLERESQASWLSNPSDYYWSILEYLNLGLKPSVINEFEKFDYQVRINAYYLGILPVILNQLGKEYTPYIHEFVSFLEDQSIRQRAIYVFAANQRWDWTKMEGQYNNLITRLREAGYQTENIQREYRVILEDVYTSTFNEDLSGAKYFDQQPGQVASFHKRSHGITYYSATEKLLIGIVCGKSSEELSSQIVYRSYQIGNLTLEPPRLFEDRPSFCGRLRHVHHSFSVEENGQTVQYRHLLDYVSKNIPTDESKIAAFEEQVKRFVNQAYNTYKNEEDNAFNQKMSEAYEDKSYTSTQTPGNPYRLSRLKPYARGIHQFEMDVVDYNLRVLVSLLPKYDQDFLTHVYEYIDDIMALSFYTGSRFTTLLQEEYYHNYIRSIRSDSDLTESQLQIIDRDIRELYLYVVNRKIVDIEDKIIDYLNHNPDLQDQKDAILSIVGRLLRNIQDSLRHSVMIEGWLPQTT